MTDGVDGDAPDALLRIVDAIEDGGFNDVSLNETGETTWVVQFRAPASLPGLSERFVASGYHLSPSGRPKSLALRFPETRGYNLHDIRFATDEAVGASPMASSFMFEVIPGAEDSWHPHILSREGEDLGSDGLALARQLEDMADAFYEALSTMGHESERVR